ncbi:chlorophyll synthase ChlG [Jannaschia sp. LMIT008]|uniref:chlorophyll synthase ChlG n=1 Tax=Jannaschia maritima TaxID=3032585 RepID=UPI0028115399|nr:chlorophyll synthase ChlG [Jannaschia sp. LMIT008]
MDATIPSPGRAWPAPGALLQLLKPVTWFPPVWAYSCGVVSSGAAWGADPAAVALGLALAGPIVCGMSQAANDWCDRHVDAINEPDRPIPSGRVPGRWGLWVALAMTALALVLALRLGPWGWGATALACAAAWAYSAEPVRAKRSGLWGPGLVGLSYETLPWITGAVVLSAGTPDPRIVAVALAYGIGAHGIMTFNDFKAVEGDRATGIRSLPATLGPRRAARIACTVMLMPQGAVIAMLALWDQPIHAALIGLLVLAQLAAMRRVLRDPLRLAPWFNATGVALSVSGMMVAAFALRGLA